MSRPLVIVTRPPEDAPPLIEALERIGCDALLAPMIEITPATPKPEIALDGVQAFLITSANGVRALAAALGPAPAGRRIPVLAVGEASAEAAKQAEFEIVEAAGGDVEALSGLIAQRCNSSHGRLVHAAGRTVAGDLKGALEARGFTVERVILYEAVPVAALPPEAADALDDERCFGVLFFSPRTAETFVTLVKQAGLGEEVAHLAAVCLSEAVAEAARALSWKRVVVAAKPEQAALIEALEDALKAEAPTEARAETAEQQREQGMAEREEDLSEGEASHAPTMRRRHFTWIVGAAVLAVIGAGLYLAWPEITGQKETPVAEAPPAETPAPVAEEAPAEAPAPAPVEAGVPEPAEAEAPSVPEVPTEAPAPAEADTAVEAPKDAPPAEEPEAAAPASAEKAPADAAPAPAEVAKPATGAAPPEELAALNQRLDKLERQTTAQTGDGSVVRDAELAARLATLESRVSASETAMREAAELRKQLTDMQAEAKALTRRLATLESQSKSSLRLVALVETKAALGAAAREGAALDHELKNLRALLPSDASLGEPLATIARFNEQGAPTYAALRTRFPALAREIVKAEAEPGADSGWVDQTIARLENIVTVRKRGGELAPGSVDERLVLAERALSENDGAAALDALKDLKGGEALSAFRDDLSRRVALDEAVRAVDRYVTGVAAGQIVPAADAPL